MENFQSILTNPAADLAEGSNSSYKIEDGVYEAICIGLADIGDVKTDYKGAEKNQHKIMIAFALNHKFANGEYAVITNRYTASLFENARLAKDLAAWKIDISGKFKLTDLLGRRAKIVVSTSGKYANIVNILQTKDTSFNVPQVYLPSYWFDNNWPIYAVDGLLAGRRPKKDTTLKDAALPKATTREEYTSSNAPQATAKAIPTPAPAPEQEKTEDDLPF